MEDDLNVKAALLSLFNNKNLKKNGFDTIEIDLVIIEGNHEIQTLSRSPRQKVRSGK